MENICKENSCIMLCKNCTFANLLSDEEMLECSLLKEKVELYATCKSFNDENSKKNFVCRHCNQ